jgi:hypothetical protein
MENKNIREELDMFSYTPSRDNKGNWKKHFERVEEVKNRIPLTPYRKKRLRQTT